MTTESIVIEQTVTEISISFEALDQEIHGTCELLVRHKRNRLKLQKDKAIYAVGDDPLRLDNQIEEESKQISGLIPLLRKLYFRKLLLLVSRANLTSIEIATLFRQCRPDNFVKRLPTPETYTRLIELLWEMRDIHDNETPILEFIERLASIRPDLQVGNDLRALGNEMMELGLLNIQLTARSEMEQRLKVEDKRDSALLVEIALNPGTTTDYLVRMYYWENGVTVECWHKQENDASGHYNRTYKLHEIPNLLYSVLSEHEEKPASIEFFLPKELLVEPVDQWASDDDLVKFRSEHKIVIRSQERIAKRELSKWRQAWREKWQMFQTLKDDRDIYWVESPSTYEVATFAQRLIFAKEKASCLGFTYLPLHREGEQERNSLLLQVLRAGVPVMAWSRTRNNDIFIAQDLRDELATVLCKEHLDNLPAIVHQLRTCQEVLDSVEHIGNRLALFWDDPERIPDIYKW